jgi:lipoic acid synthetase
MDTAGGRRKPDWLAVQPPAGRQFTDIRETLREHDLHTVCEEASCPNLGECWSGRGVAPPDEAAAETADGREHAPPDEAAVDAADGRGGAGGTATFMLLGERCSRGCNFCDVETGGMAPPDPDEPANVASAVADIGLEYVVLTSVDRDDLPDQGAGHFAETVREIKRRDPGILVEALIPDFRGERALVERVVDAGADVVAHNVETVERLQRPVRDPRAGYEQSLDVLAAVADSPAYAKTSLMLGLGEYSHEVYRALADLRAMGVDVVTLGQYLRPSRTHLDVKEYVHPATFETWRAVAEEEVGFLYCAAGPMVRSSYRAGELFVDAVARDGLTPAEARERARRRVGD